MVIVLQKAKCYEIKSIYRTHDVDGSIKQISFRLKGIREAYVIYYEESIKQFESLKLKRGDLITVFDHYTHHWSIVKGNVVPQYK